MCDYVCLKYFHSYRTHKLAAGYKSKNGCGLVNSYVTNNTNVFRTKSYTAIEKCGTDVHTIGSVRNIISAEKEVDFWRNDQTGLILNIS